MGFKSLIEKQVHGAMRILGTGPNGLAATRAFHSISGEEVYDPVTRRTTEVATEYTVPMTFVRFKIDDMDAEVRPKTDRRALIAKLDLPVVPKETDYIVDESGIRWNVQRVLSDPADALYILHTRRVS